MSFSSGFSSGFFSGTAAVTSLVPDVYPCALNGRPYMLDLREGFGLRRRSIPMLRQQADTSGVIGESSLSPEDLIRRAVESGHYGAGQTYRDRPESNPYRYRTAKGVDVWTRDALSLLPGVLQAKSSANTNLRVVPVGTYLYLTDGASIQYTADPFAAPATWTDITGEPATAPTSIATDGYNVYTAHGSDGIYKTTRAAGSTASHITGTVALVAVAKGRLIAAQGNVLYNPTAAGALPAALYTHPNSDWSWTCVAEGPGHIYAGGYSGDKSIVYKTLVKADGTALDTPTVAGELPDGEVLRSMQGYLGYLLLGTDKGVRFASLDGDGNLVVGALIPTSAAVECFEPQEQYVWFGWKNYDGVSTGLGRLDLTAFTAANTPAYASDLMATGQGGVLSVATFSGKRVFTVSGLGVYAQGTDLVASGVLDTGIITYGLADDKIAMFLDVSTDDIDGSVAAALAGDNGTFANVGTATAGTFNTFPVAEVRAGKYEMRLTLTRDGSDATAGPTVRRAVLRAFPSPARGEEIIAFLVLHETVNVGGSNQDVDVDAELSAIRSLVNPPQATTWQDGFGTTSVMVDTYEFVAESLRSDGGLRGTCLVRMKAVD